MAENRDRAREYDAVLGGQNPPPVDAAILGGLEGVKLRLANPYIEVRVTALKDAIKYGKVGLDLVIQQALQDKSHQVKFTAYYLLKDRTESKVKQHLDKIFPRFEFDVITVNELGQESSRRLQEAQYFTEYLGNGYYMDMVLIPGGTFMMGSPDTEEGGRYNESPQHQVTVPSFFMGKYQVTQSQWETIAGLPEINRPLHPNPSKCKGAVLPVENVSWQEAQEFCARLSRKTGKNYRLPSEAEWEYACRAGTTTPFHFGETITTDLVNYNGIQTYGSAPKGIYRYQTTDVGHFPPNAFGLYDMHGNVWEWCADPAYENYDAAPNDGSVWESSGDKYPRRRRLRGGSCYIGPKDCRSAFRGSDVGDGNCAIGIRVLCDAA